jgi:hypothetical protein
MKLTVCVLVLSLTVVASAFAVVVGMGIAQAAEDAGDLAKQTQNPVSDLISIPFQYNMHFGTGLNNRM